MTEEQVDKADEMEREDIESGCVDTRDVATERENHLWNAGSEARYQDELQQMATNDENRS